MNRPVNFSAGPSVLPVEVLKTLSQEMLDYNGTGLSMVEMSHRETPYREVHNRVIFLLRELMEIPESYCILLLSGGATLQFSMIPMNFLLPNCRADYINSGAWAQKAITEAKKFGSISIPWDGASNRYCTLPDLTDLTIHKNSSYLHITSNETIGGIQWKTFPDTQEVPLFADMSSDILSRPIDVSRFALIYAGAQKNLGPAGATVVIIRKNLLSRCPNNLGSYLNYAVHAESNSLYNTPPVFSIWAMKLVLENLKDRGGLSKVAGENKHQAAALYRLIDESEGFYRNPVDPNMRSDMNIVWRLRTKQLDNKFLEEAAANGLVGLKGHRSVGGCRASLYNAMSMDGVMRLMELMRDFASRHYDSD